MSRRRGLSPSEIRRAVEEISENEDDLLSTDNDEESDSEVDFESLASEASDEHEETDASDSEYYNENGTETVVTQYHGKDGTGWFAEPTSTGRARSHNIVRGSINKVLLPPSACIECPVDAFSLYMDESIVAEIVRYTNAEAQRVYKEKRPKQWNDCDKVEMYAFIGLLLTAGHLKSNHCNYDTLWNSVYGPPIFRATMGLKRFKSILAFIRFDDKTTRSIRRQKDKFAPIRNIWEKINSNFRKYYLPGTNITVDEQLIGFRGRCPFKQYLPSKPDKYGMKVWWACDSETFYPLNGMPYLGKENGQRAAPGLGRRVVEALTEPYQGTNRNVTCDNYFTDKDLALNLLSRGLTLVGTVRKNKTFLPSQFLTNKHRPEGTSIFGFSRKITIVSFVPSKNRSVALLSTMHHDGTLSSNGKPEIIMYYNKTKGGVDALDQLVHTYSCKRRSNRWPLTFFMNSLDVCGVAAYVIWRNLNPEWNVKKHEIRRLFIVDVAEDLVRPHIVRRQSQRGLNKKCRLSITHVIGEAAPSTSKKNEDNAKKRCHLCHWERSRKQRQRCSICSKPVCNEHSQVNRVCQICNASNNV